MIDLLMQSNQYRPILTPFDRYDRSWWFRLHRCVAAFNREFEIERKKLHQLHYLFGMLVGKSSTNTQHASQALVDFENAYFPSEEESPNLVEADIEKLHRMWQEEFGTYGDPETERRIQATVDALNRR